MRELDGTITCETFNYGWVTVRPADQGPEAEVQILDQMNQVLYQTTIQAS